MNRKAKSKQIQCRQIVHDNEKYLMQTFVLEEANTWFCKYSDTLWYIPMSMSKYELRALCSDSEVRTMHMYIDDLDYHLKSMKNMCICIYFNLL